MLNKILLVRIDVGKMRPDKVADYLRDYKKMLAPTFDKLDSSAIEVLYIPVRDGQVRGIEMEVVHLR